MNAVQYLRTFVAILCLAAILVGHWNPTSAGLLCAAPDTGRRLFWLRFVKTPATVAGPRAPHPRLVSPSPSSPPGRLPVACSACNLQ